MNRVSDQTYLLNDQYKDASNFTARFQLHERFSVNPQGWFPWVLDRVRLPAEARVLEVGCGPGWLWERNLERIPKGWDVTLTDFSPGMLEEAKHNLPDGDRRFRFEVADAQAITFVARLTRPSKILANRHCEEDIAFGCPTKQSHSVI